MLIASITRHIATIALIAQLFHMRVQMKANKPLLQVSTLVRYKCPETGTPTVGHVTDAFSDDDGYMMLEVITLDPFDRGWFDQHELEVLDESSK
jgi:hypothetical protein|tara:strand:- start:121 stop:402 length:282 start_codon:yes stop_codon:yes gene_type:complete